jgi:predicted dehydrogenase
VHRMEIVGTGGTLRWDNADGLLHLHWMPATFGTWSANPPASVVEQYAPPEGFERNTMFLDQMRHFIAVVRGEVEPLCTLEDGRLALQMAIAARESGQSGRLVHIQHQ